jgi:SAM-dependent methyltransferase/uncharacterized protein YbaR (Trm112 family)
MEPTGQPGGDAGAPYGSYERVHRHWPQVQRHVLLLNFHELIPWFGKETEWKKTDTVDDRDVLQSNSRCRTHRPNEAAGLRRRGIRGTRNPNWPGLAEASSLAGVQSLLSALPARLMCPSCRDNRSNLGTTVFTEGSEGHVRDGVLICSECREWYPIEDDVLEFVRPELLYPEDAVIFQRRFEAQLEAAGCRPHDIASAPASLADGDHLEQRKQRNHFDRYAESLEPGFADYTQSTFIRTASRRFMDLWKVRLGNSEGWILDIGCGTGINSFPATDHHIVTGFDISKRVIQRDTEEARTRGVMASTTFFVADGGFLCFKDESFDFAQTFGALHHLPNPAQAIKDIVRILRPNGIYFGVENNKTALRWIFDLMMRIRPLWVEEAGAEPLISGAMIREWAAGQQVEVHCESSVFLPPHLFNMLGAKTARTLLNFSDRASLLVPWLRDNGGQLIYHMRKAPRSSGAR